MWTLGIGEAPYGYLGPLLGRGADGGFGEIGLCKSRLGGIVPVKGLSFLSFGLCRDRGKKATSRFKVPGQERFGAQPGTYGL